MVFGKHGTDIQEGVNYDRLRKERLQRARDQVNKDGLGALLTCDADSIRHIAAHYVTTPLRSGQLNLVVLPRNGDPVLFQPQNIAKMNQLMPWLKGRIRAGVGITKLFQTPSDASSLVEAVGGIMAEHGVTNEPLGMDGFTSELLLAEAFKGAGIKAVDGRYTMLEARKIKTRDEIELMRITCANTEPVFAAIKDAIRPGIRECDLVGIGVKVLYELGDDHTEDLVCCSGYNTNPFDLSFTDKPIRPGELIYIDVDGCQYQGYRSCCYRTFSCGKATAEQKELYEECRVMLYNGMSAVKAGNTTLDVAEKWPTSPSYWGYETWDEALPLAIAHGIGLCLHEIPMFNYPAAKANPVKLEENMVLALETWTGKKGGKDGVRLEEDVVVTKDGYELLTKWPIDEITECWP